MTESPAPSKEVVNHVLDSFLIFESYELLDSIVGLAPASQLQATFVGDASQGLRSVIAAGTLPFRLISHSVQQRHFDRIHTAERIRSHLHIAPDEEPSEQRREQALQTSNQRMREFISSDEGIKVFRDGIVSELNHKLQSSDISEAASELLVQTLVSTWAVFESSVRKFIVAWLNANPQSANPVVEAPDLKSYFGKQVVDISVIGEHAFDLTRSMGEILFRERRLDNLGVIRSILEAIFSDPDTRSALGDDMWMLNQRRHLFVHKRGIVDAEYLKRTGDKVSLGQLLRVTSEDVELYLRAVGRAVAAIAVASDKGGVAN